MGFTMAMIEVVVLYIFTKKWRTWDVARVAGRDDLTLFHHVPYWFESWIQLILVQFPYPLGSLEPLYCGETVPCFLVSAALDPPA